MYTITTISGDQRIEVTAPTAYGAWMLHLAQSHYRERSREESTRLDNVLKGVDSQKDAAEPVVATEPTRGTAISFSDAGKLAESIVKAGCGDGVVSISSTAPGYADFKFGISCFSSQPRVIQMLRLYIAQAMTTYADERAKQNCNAEPTIPREAFASPEELRSVYDKLHADNSSNTIRDSIRSDAAKIAAEVDGEITGRTRGKEVAEWIISVKGEFLSIGGEPGAHFRISPPSNFEDAVSAARETIAFVIDAARADAVREALQSLDKDGWLREGYPVSAHEKTEK